MIQDTGYLNRTLLNLANFITNTSSDYTLLLGAPEERLNRDVWIIISFFGDYIKREVFNQDLNQTAAVEHTSQTLEDLKTETAEISVLLTTENSEKKELLKN